MTEDTPLSDALSILSAARDAAQATGLIVGEQHFSFARLAELTHERLRNLPRDAAGPALIVSASNTLDTIITLYALLEAQRPAVLLHPRSTAAEQAEVQAIAATRPITHADAAAVLFTSGTTGVPRGVVLTRAALIASAQASAANLGWRDDDRWLLAMSMARIGGLSILTRCLAARRTVALVPAFDATLLPQTIAQQRITLASLVPTMLARVLDAHPDWSPPAHLRAVLLGGAAASAQLLRRAAKHRLPIVITYGCTESCSQVAATPYAGRYDTARYGVGRALAGAQIRIVDARIQIRGPMRMAGYLGEPALPANDWFATGDLGEFDADGCLHIHARQGDLIISGGENVSPAEVEQVLEAFPGVTAAGVFGVEDEIWGQVVAAALVAPRKGLAHDALAAYLDTRLSPHKRPRQICLVEALPHTPAGKPDRAALQDLAPLLRPLAGATVAD